MGYTTFLLDFDHTLFDSDASELAAFRATMASIGTPDPDAHLATYVAINRELWAAVERHELTPTQVRTLRFEQLIAATGIEGDAETMAEVFVDGLASNGELYPGAREVLDQLASRCTLALLTNGLSEVQRRRVERLGLAELFDAIVISAEVGCSKPAPAFFDLSLRQLRLEDPTGALMVGDSLSADIVGAAAFGLATCWYNPRRLPRPAGTPLGHEIAALGDLLSFC